jgi:hypothetical protein
MQPARLYGAATPYYPTGHITLPEKEIQEFQHYCTQLLGVASICTEQDPEDNSQMRFFVGVTRNKEQIIEGLLQDQKMTKVNQKYYHKGMLVEFSTEGQVKAY